MVKSSFSLSLYLYTLYSFLFMQQTEISVAVREFGTPAATTVNISPAPSGDDDLTAVLLDVPGDPAVGLTTFDPNASYQNNHAPNDFISQLVQPWGLAVNQVMQRRSARLRGGKGDEMKMWMGWCDQRNTSPNTSTHEDRKKHLRDEDCVHLHFHVALLTSQSHLQHREASF